LIWSPHFEVKGAVPLDARCSEMDKKVRKIQATGRAEALHD
jgi:hypothetical protein